MHSRFEAAVELRLGEKRTGQTQDLVGVVQLLDLSLERLNPFRSALVALGLWPVSRSC
jgi:hypothetical protein